VLLLLLLLLGVVVELLLLLLGVLGMVVLQHRGILPIHVQVSTSCCCCCSCLWLHRHLHPLHSGAHRRAWCCCSPCQDVPLAPQLHRMPLPLTQLLRLARLPLRHTSNTLAREYATTMAHKPQHLQRLRGCWLQQLLLPAMCRCAVCFITGPHQLLQELHVVTVTCQPAQIGAQLLVSLKPADQQ
jgi:hypothetical protein